VRLLTNTQLSAGTFQIWADNYPVTDKVAIFQCTLPDGTMFYLADTPGFDDDKQSDTDILREVARWLNSAYEQKISLTGIIYLQKISDNRVGGAGSKNLRMFKKLCGQNSLASVVLATTMWGEVNQAAGERRETQLKTSTKPKPDFWKSMIDQGSKVLRQDREKESATEIINYLIEKKRPVTLDIVDEMVNNGKKLDETAAGREVQDEIERQRVIYEQKMENIRSEMIEAANERDRERQEELRVERERFIAKQEQHLIDLRNLQATNAELQEQRREDEQRERAEWLREMREQARKSAQAETQIQVLKAQMVERANREVLINQLRDTEAAKAQSDTEKAHWERKYKNRCVLM
jgi:hypothetical protein